MVPWEYFSKRRNVTLKDIAIVNGFSKTEDLSTYLKNLGVTCPNQQSLEQAINSLIEKEPEEEVIPEVPKKRTYRKKASKKPAEPK